MGNENGSAVRIHTVEMTKDYGRAAVDEQVARNLDEIIAAVNTSGRIARGWKLALRPITEGSTQWYRVEMLSSSMTGPRRYHFFFELTGTNTKTDSESELPNVLKTMDSKGSSYSGNPYMVAGVDGQKYSEQSVEAKRKQAAAKGDVIPYAPFEVPTNVREYFSRLYGLDAHINRLLKTVALAEQTDFRNRVNTVLIGPPGCGKTDVCRSLKAAVGAESVYEIDATSMTKAGVLQDLDDMEELPRLIIIEEIEKAQGEALSFLLGIMDTRGEIRKTTARGRIDKDIKCLVVATVNNKKRFLELNYGALSSRFSNVIHFNRPDDALLTRILEREIDSVVGTGEKNSGKKKYGWIKPTLEWCKEVNNYDPRYVIAICLTGQDDLLNGTYVADLRATMPHDDSGDIAEWDVA